MMRLRGLVVAAAAALVLVPGAAPASEQTPQLFGTVGPGFTITLEDASGASVTRIEPGTYVIQVRDLSPDHNYHVSGPGVNQATGVETEGTVTWTITFREGRYTIVCDPHPAEMNRPLTVGNPPPLPPPPPPPTPKPKPKPPTKLLATVGPKATISLRSAAGAVLHHGVKAGTYAVVVRDRSKAHNFHLVGKGVNRKSTVAGTGTQTWTVKFSVGVLRFYSDRAPKTVKGSVRVR
jgi:plastocyanin